MLHEPLQNLGEGNLSHLIASNVHLIFLYMQVRFLQFNTSLRGSKPFDGNLVKTAALAAHVVLHKWRLLY